MDGLPKDIKRLCENGSLNEALLLSQHRGFPSSTKLLSCLLQVILMWEIQIMPSSCITECGQHQQQLMARLIHMHIRKSGFENHTHIANSLITMYAKCGCLSDAQMLFAKMVHKDSVTWGAMITAYLQHGQDKEALLCFSLMRKQSVTPNRVTFICVLKACSSSIHLIQGKCIHTDIIELGFESEPSLVNSIVNMYANCGSLHDARRVFNRLAKRNEVSWNVMVEAYDQEGNAEEAIRLYERMQLEVDEDRVEKLKLKCRESVIEKHVDFLTNLSCRELVDLCEGIIADLHSMTDEHFAMAIV